MQPPYTIDSGCEGPSVLITAGVHGDEYEPIIAANHLISNLSPQLKRGKLTIVPIVNTTAVANGSRYGSDGLDLARVCPGNSQGSVTEVDAAKISAIIVQSDYLIDMHTGGKLFDIYPLAGYMLHPDSNVLDQQRTMAKAFGLPIIWGTDHEPNGRTLSVARDHNIPAIYVEYGGGITARDEIVHAYTIGCVGVLKKLAMIDTAEEIYRAPEHIVEDSTPQHGHLQAKMPSPAEGIFVPGVELGQMIVAGEHWGDIVDLETAKHTKVFAELSGMVLFLRVDARVNVGESLGGILPINIKTNA
jgi:predicted deacylase